MRERERERESQSQSERRGRERVERDTEREMLGCELAALAASVLRLADSVTPL